MKKYTIIIFIMFCYAEVSAQTQNMQVETLFKNFASLDSYSLRYDVKTYLEKNKIAATDSFSMFYVKTGDKYVALERNVLVIGDPEYTLMVDDNAQIIYVQTNVEDTYQGVNFFDAERPILKNATIADTIVNGMPAYMVNSFGDGYTSIQFLFQKNNLMPFQIVMTAEPRFDELNGKQTIIFPKSVMNITYSNQPDFSGFKAVELEDVIIFSPANQFSLTSKFSSYELYVL